MSVEVVTFGCRLNSAESEVIRREATAAGVTDAVVVNTCAVTSEAVRQARQTIRRFKRERPETKIVVTGNYRAWRHFIGMRATEAADVEIRTLAVAVLRELQALAPNVFADFRISELADGTAVAASPLVGDG